MSLSEHKLTEQVAEDVTLNTGLSTDVVDYRNGDYVNIKMWRTLNWECLISPFLALAVELDGFREFS
jgi:hypothetical protein